MSNLCKKLFSRLLRHTTQEASPVIAMFGSRSRTCSESSEGGGAGDASATTTPRLGTSAPTGGFLTSGLLGQNAANMSGGGTAYDLEGKFTYNQVSNLQSG